MILILPGELVDESCYDDLLQASAEDTFRMVVLMYHQLSVCSAC